MSVVKGRFKFTMARIEKIDRPQSGQDLYFDTELRGFGLIIGTRKASYFAEKSYQGRPKRITFASPNEMTPEDARKVARQHIAAIALGKDPVNERRTAEASTVTLQEILDDFLAFRAKYGGRRRKNPMKPATAREYRATMRLYFPDWLKKPAASITAKAVIRRHTELGARGMPTADGAMRVLRAVFEWATNSAVYDGVITVNPVMSLTKEGRWGVNKPRTGHLRPSELPGVYRVIMELQNPQGRDYLLLLMFTGMRRAEAMRLRWSDVDFVERTLTVRETKNHKPLVLPLSTFLEQMLRERKEKYRENDWVFPGGGKTGHMVEPARVLGQVQRDSGVMFTLHDLRRTFATIGESLEVSFVALKSLLNHSAGGDVTTSYIQITPDRLRDPMQRITDYLLLTTHAWSPWQPKEGQRAEAAEGRPGGKVIPLRRAV